MEGLGEAAELKIVTGAAASIRGGTARFADGSRRKSRWPLQRKFARLSARTENCRLAVSGFNTLCARSFLSSLLPWLGDFWGSGSYYELELLGAEIRVRGGEFHGAWLFFGANPDCASAAD